MANELFSIAIPRLKRAVKLRKEAIEYFKAQYGNKESIVEPDSPDIIYNPMRATTLQVDKASEPERKSIRL